MSSVNLRAQIQSRFRLHGLSLKVDAISRLEKLLSTLPSPQQVELWLSKIIETVQKQNVTTSVLSVDVINSAVKECRHQVDDRASTITADSVELFGSTKSKAEFYQDRYTAIHQRLQRHEVFAPIIFSSSADSNRDKFRLKNVEALMGMNKDETVVVFGMLTQLKHGRIFLEDPTGVVELDFSIFNENRKTRSPEGIFTEGSLMIVEGTYDAHVLYVHNLGQPPIEISKKTREYFGNTNFFGGPATSSVKSSVRLQQMEVENEDVSFVILSDVWLNDPKVLQKLNQLFDGFNDAPPFCFIFCGNFSSQPFGTATVQNYRTGFKKLTEILAQYPTITEQSYFVFVPGLQDPILSDILPRPPLPDYFVGLMKSKIPKCIFTTNPCRIQYCTQEIVVFREDMIHKMCRNSIFPPFHSLSITEHFARTLLSQSHLTPLPLHVSPVHWAYDYALSLYPIPDLVIIGDKYDPFTHQWKNTIVTNPGSFPRSNFAFKVYIPATKTVENSMIPHD